MASLDVIPSRYSVQRQIRKRLETLCFYCDVQVVDRKMDLVVKGNNRFNEPNVSQLLSISFLCLRYMGQTWPSNRPGGSGTVYVLVLRIHHGSSHITTWTTCPTTNWSLLLKRALPSPPLALLTRNGNVVTLVIDVDQRPAGRSSG